MAAALVLAAASLAAEPTPDPAPPLTPYVPFAGGGPRELVAHLEKRLGAHRWVCANGSRRWPRVRWHCRARVWTTRELGEARRKLERWENTVPAWPWQAIARCENRGSGLYGINWTAYNSTYEGAYGFLHSTWDAYRYPGMPDRADRATPREQTLVAMRLRRVFGNFSSWPACHRRLGLP